MGINIRRAGVTDAPLLALLNRTVQGLHADSRPDVFLPPADLEAVRRYFEAILAEPENHCFVAEAAETAVGYLYCQVVRRPENPFTRARQYIYIHQMSVEPAWQRQGVGGELMAAARGLARALSIHHLALDTWSFNEAAQAFFAGQGFATFNVRMEVFLDGPQVTRG